MLIENIVIEKKGKHWFDPTRWSATALVDKRTFYGFGFTKKSAVRDLTHKIASEVNKKVFKEFDKSTVIEI